MLLWSPGPLTEHLTDCGGPGQNPWGGLGKRQKRQKRQKIQKRQNKTAKTIVFSSISSILDFENIEKPKQNIGFLRFFMEKGKTKMQKHCFLQHLVDFVLSFFHEKLKKTYVLLRFFYVFEV